MSDVGIGLLLFACLLVAVALIRFFSWLTELQEEHGSITRAGVNTVKRYVAVERSVMSLGDENVAPSLRLSQETQAQTDRQTEQAPRIRAEDLLTLCKLMRLAGISREDAQEAFRESGLPFNNNVWAKAAAPQASADASYVTPIVGRPTSARFDVTDPDYPYQAPAH
jgi:hypothetical protein